MLNRSPSQWQRFFDGHAPVYEENCFTKNTVAEVDFLVEELKLSAGVSVLDVGCGTGRHAIELARRGMRVTGIDLSSGMLEQARNNADRAGVEVTLLQRDATDFSFDEPFDVAICVCEGAFGLLGSADDPLGQPQAILRCVGQSLKAGGQCLFTVLNALRSIRQHGMDDIQQGVFDPLRLAVQTDAVQSDGNLAGSDNSERTSLSERHFVPTELVLLFALAGIEVTDMWGGTAGNWGRRPIDPDEYEIMVVGQKVNDPPQAPYAIYSRG